MSAAHHGDDGEQSRVQKELMDLFRKQQNGEARRAWPNGRVAAEDDGQLAFAIGADRDKGIVFVDFGKDVSWIGLPPEQAVALAELLIANAKKVSEKPLTVNL